MSDREETLQQEVIEELFDNASLARWFSELLAGPQNQEPEPVSAVEGMVELGYIEKSSKAWRITNRGYLFAEGIIDFVSRRSIGASGKERSRGK